MLHSVRIKLLITLLSFVLITVISFVFSYNYVTSSKEKLSEIKQNINETNVLLLEDVNVIRDFLSYETISSSFFETGKSKFLDKHFKICKRIESFLQIIETSQNKLDYNLNDEIKSIKEKFKMHKKLTSNILKQILIMGFKDYGVEGKMRYYAHALEENKAEIGLANILQLRRHEKDFIIRQEDQYIMKHSNLVARIRNKVKNETGNASKKNRIISVLNNYSSEFLRLTKFEKLIGLKNQKGLKKEIDTNSSSLGTEFANMIVFASQKEKINLAQINLLFLLMSFIFILICIIAAVVISKKASKSITNLKDNISEFIESDFTKTTKFTDNDSRYEVDILASNFNVMELQIVNQLKALKETNEELESLLYRSSHDLKEPLANIKGLTNLANEKIADPDALFYFSLINDSCGKLNTIVDELAMIKSIKSGAIEKEVIHFDKMISSIFYEFKLLPNFDNIIFSMDFKIQKEFFSDPKHIKIIFRKLIENGIKYSKNGKSMPFIKVSIQEEKNNILKIIVSDNGIGIKKEFQGKVFDMFSKGNQLSSGTGLGLYMVQNSLRKLNGAISLESEEGKGTSFIILLPNVTMERKTRERILHKSEISKLGKENMVLNYI